MPFCQRTLPENSAFQARLGGGLAIARIITCLVAGFGGHLAAQEAVTSEPIDPFSRYVRPVYPNVQTSANIPAVAYPAPPASAPAEPPVQILSMPPQGTILPGSMPPGSMPFNPQQPGYPEGPAMMGGPQYDPILSTDLVGNSAETPGSHKWLDHLETGVLVRGYYRNDQRIEWSGMEETFGAEGVVTPRIHERYGELDLQVNGEFYLNQPYDRNQLFNDPERKSYAANFKVNTFDISQLFIASTYGDWTFKIGRFATPFGRTYFPLYSNAMSDAPFIRTEAILWRETGMLVHYKPGAFVADLAFTNGGENLDSNSTKALIARIGLEGDNWAFGASFKKQDGVGSEEQKQTGNHAGIDAMIRGGPFTLSGECIYDEYGFGRPGFDPLKVTWAKSIYYRDVSTGQYRPLTGFGYYVNLDYKQGPWTTSLNYGEYYPLFSGDAPNQRIQWRGIVKVAYQFNNPLEFFSVVMVENGNYIAQENEPRKPYYVLEGFQMKF